MSLPKNFSQLPDEVLDSIITIESKNMIRSRCSPANYLRREMANGKTLRDVISFWISNGCGTSGKTGKPFSEFRDPNQTAWCSLRWEINNDRLSLQSPEPETTTSSKQWIQQQEDQQAASDSLESESLRLRAGGRTKQSPKSESGENTTDNMTSRRIQMKQRFTQLRDTMNQEMESDLDREESRQMAEGVVDTLECDLREWREWDAQKAQAAQRQLVRPSELKGRIDTCETFDV